jgi:tRNA 2-thiouridine synthesizing protein E
MSSLIHSMIDVERDEARNALFPHAPEGWTARNARTAARAEGLALTDEHWQVVRALQEYFARHEERERNMRELHDALDELFHAGGGMRYLYTLFPKGPVAQGCRIAGLHASDIVADRSFGSVM